MSNTIFTIELPIIKSDKKIEEKKEEFEKVKKLYPQYDPDYLKCGCIIEKREYLDKLWVKYKSYADKHFLNQIRTNFFQRTWEIYMGNVFLKSGFAMRSMDEGPDFIINKIAYIECVSPTKGDPTKQDSVPELKMPILWKVYCRDLSRDEIKMILRITQAIKEKATVQYKKWRRKKWFDSKMPFIIAVNTADVVSIEDPEVPIVLRSLFGIKNKQIDMKTGKVSFSYRDDVSKSNNKFIPVNYFVNKKIDFVSGILFSNKSALDYPKNIGEDCFFVNNPFAKNPVKEFFVKLFKGWEATNKKNGIIELSCFERNVNQQNKIN